MTLSNDLPRIVIPSKNNLKAILKWRDRNKELVRNFNAPIKEGVIDFKGVYVQYFKQVGRKVHHEYYVSGVIKGISFDFDLDTWRVTNIKDNVQMDYEKVDRYQDMITIHASLMAFIENCPNKVVHVDNIYQVKP